MRDGAKRAVRTLLPAVLILGAAVLVALLLVSTRPLPERREPEPVRVLVEIIEVRPEDRRVSVSGRGDVVPRRQVSLQAEIAGRVAWKNESLVDGGVVRRGEALVRLDDREQRLAVSERRADLQSARVALREEEARGRAVRRELELLGDLGERARQNELALREPQLEAARVALEAAGSALERARLNLSRTVVEGPLDGLVREAPVSVGQYVAPQMEIASLVGTDSFWVRAALPAADAVMVEPGARARVILTQGQPEVYEGVVLRLLGELEPAGRLARLLVEVPDPLGLSRPGAGQRPLLIGSFVQVEMEAGVFEDVFVLPRRALRQGNEVFVKDDDGRLRIREVTIAWSDREEVLVSSGLEPGERAIVSRLPGGVEGMLLRVADEAER